jgi:signal transduction histidine kinase/ActR/RegA family two-component response regulator
MTGPTYSVVLADDVAALRKLVRLALEAGGHFQVVAEAATGHEAIAKAREVQPDLVLLDLSMPELDGLEALPRVLEAAPRTHVVVLSGFNHVRMAPIALRLGASAYLEKGMDPKDLVRDLVAILEAPRAAAPAANGAQPHQPGGNGGPPSVGSTSPAADRPAKPATFRAGVLAAEPGRATALTALLANGGRFEARPLASLAELQALLADADADLVLVEPPANPQGEDLLIDVLTAATTVPVVALLPAHDDALAGRAMRLGIEDCLPNEGLDPRLLERSLLYAIERRRAQDARRTLRDQQGTLQRLRELDVLKSEFFNAAAHELGTPLTPIRLQMARLKAMRGAAAGPEEQKSLQILDRNVQRLLRLNQDILDVARLEAGHFSVERRPMHLDDVVREVADTLEPVARERAIRLTASCSVEASLEGDASRLGQVLFNLVGNALKFTGSGGTVAVEVGVEGEHCRLTVRDTGIGLRPEQIARLFKPFSQVLGAEQPRGVGSGLGLFVSRGIVELHGGTIECTSAGPGQGSTFTVRIPRQAADERPTVTAHSVAHLPPEVAAEVA